MWSAMKHRPAELITPAPPTPCGLSSQGMAESVQLPDRPPSSEVLFAHLLGPRAERQLMDIREPMLRSTRSERPSVELEPPQATPCGPRSQGAPEMELEPNGISRPIDECSGTDSTCQVVLIPGVEFEHPPETPCGLRSQGASQLEIQPMSSTPCGLASQGASGFKRPIHRRMGTGSTCSHCPICPARLRHCDRHVRRRHFPWYVALYTCCWACEKQFRQSGQLAKHLQAGCPESARANPNFAGNETQWVYLMNGLLNFVCGCQGLITKQAVLDRMRDMAITTDPLVRINAMDRELMTLFAEHNGLPPVPRDLDLRRPVHLVALLYWRVLATLVGGLPEAWRTGIPVVPSCTLGLE